MLSVILLLCQFLAMKQTVLSISLYNSTNLKWQKSNRNLILVFFSLQWYFKYFCPFFNPKKCEIQSGTSKLKLYSSFFLDFSFSFKRENFEKKDTKYTLEEIQGNMTKEKKSEKQPFVSFLWKTHNTHTYPRNHWIIVMRNVW